MADGGGVRARAARSGHRVPRVDLQSVRVTLEYIHGDLRTVPELARVAAALGQALDELDRVGCRSPDPRFERLVGLPEGRFLR